MREPCRSIDSFFIAGFQRYDGPTVLGDIAPGTALDLIGEPDNPFDPHAVRISLRGVKLGYVPKGKNELASLLAFYGHAGVLECRVTQVNPLTPGSRFAWASSPAPPTGTATSPSCTSP